MQVGEGDLGGANEPKVVFHVVVNVLLKLGQLRGANQALTLDYGWGIDLGVTVLLDVQVQHPGDERPLQARPQPAQHVEAGAGELDTALKVHDAQHWPQIPVRQRLKAELSRLSLGAQNDVLTLVLAHRHTFVGQVGHVQLCVVELPFHVTQGHVQGLDPLTELAHFLSDGFEFSFQHLSLVRADLFEAPLEAAHLFGCGVTLGLQALHLRQQLATFGVQFQDQVNRGVRVQLDHRGFYFVQVLADVNQV